MAATRYDVAQSWAEQVGTPNPRYRRNASCNVFVSDDRRRKNRIYSYGYHFELGRLIGDRATGVVLLNGDRYSVTTSAHQTMVRAAVASARLRYMIVPYTALNRAGIEIDTIRPLEVGEDGWKDVQRIDKHGNPYTAQVHTLGSALFSAVAGGRRHKFLSDFDTLESRPLYFLAELPRTSAVTIEQALDALAPRAVHAALAQGRRVLRQGDIFAIPVGLDTRSLTRRAVRREKGASLLGTDHYASEVVTCRGGVVYARGTMRHAPERRNPDHARRTLGKSWHLIVRNTVPRATRTTNTRRVAP